MSVIKDRNKEGNWGGGGVKMFYLCLYGVGYMVKDHSIKKVETFMGYSFR